MTDQEASVGHHSFLTSQISHDTNKLSKKLYFSTVFWWFWGLVRSRKTIISVKNHKMKRLVAPRTTNLHPFFVGDFLNPQNTEGGLVCFVGGGV